jgi:hypothetical protein
VDPSQVTRIRDSHRFICHPVDGCRGLVLACWVELCMDSTAPRLEPWCARRTTKITRTQEQQKPLPHGRGSVNNNDHDNNDDDDDNGRHVGPAVLSLQGERSTRLHRPRSETRQTIETSQ